MDVLPIKRPFRFLTDEEFSALDMKAKAVYLVSAQQTVESQQIVLRRYRENFTAQLAAIVQLHDGSRLQVPGPDTPQ